MEGLRALSAIRSETIMILSDHLVSPESDVTFICGQMQNKTFSEKYEKREARERGCWRGEKSEGPAAVPGSACRWPPSPGLRVTAAGHRDTGRTCPGTGTGGWAPALAMSVLQTRRLKLRVIRCHIAAFSSVTGPRLPA